MRVCGAPQDTYIRSHAAPSERVPTVRTDVPITQELHARAAHARRPASHSLVPTARGRLRRRLGGRPERGVTDAEASAPSIAARARESLAAVGVDAAARPAPARCASLLVPRRVAGIGIGIGIGRASRKDPHDARSTSSLAASLLARPTPRCPCSKTAR